MKIKIFIILMLLAAVPALADVNPAPFKRCLNSQSYNVCSSANDYYTSHYPNPPSMNHLDRCDIAYFLAFDDGMMYFTSGDKELEYGMAAGFAFVLNNNCPAGEVNAVKKMTKKLEDAGL